MMLRSGYGLHRSRGFIVVAVLWILAALSALVLIYLTYVTNTAVVVAASTDRVQVDALVSAGVELTAYQLTAVNDDVRPSSGTFSARMGAAQVSVAFRSEAARVDLNAAPKGLLAGLIIGLGAAPSNAADYADRILAWRAPVTASENDPETSSYRTAGLSYAPRHAPFPHADELWLVRGIPPPLVERMLPFVTAFSNMASINIKDAAPQVVAALPGMTPERLQAVLSQRDDPRFDPHALVGLVGGAAATLEASKAYRLTVVIDFDRGRRSAAEVVILLLEDGDEPYRVLSWRNASDGATAPQWAAIR
ncbi:general secretion pathway protein GspK [uncultured Bradyrhizobium sp.]|uniref:general secretion pathway protein GspK n=1 Tax=uncultured Bradyrhizobium sp. TaxID=199684 RepID=UPI0035CBCE19